MGSTGCVLCGSTLKTDNVKGEDAKEYNYKVRGRMSCGVVDVFYANRGGRVVRGDASCLGGCEFATGAYPEFKFGLAAVLWLSPH
jgi:hypothetical protein